MALRATRQLGDTEVTLLTDGSFTFGPDLFPTTDEAEIRALLSTAGEAEIKTNFNAVLIRRNDRLVLADAGPRDLFGPACGKLPDALEEVGVTPDQIDTVFATHMHPDHVAGMITVDGAAVFTNAELVVTEGEHAFWAADRFATASPRMQDWAKLAQAVFAAYGDRLRLIGAEDAIAPGLTALPLPGHTPGHSGWRLEAEGAQLLHVGDIVHAPVLQVRDPSIGIAFDIDIETARETRQRLLDELATDQLMFTGGHFLHPAFHHVERFANGYRLRRP